MDVKIEKCADGSYIAYCPDAENYVVIGSGSTVKETKDDFDNSLREMRECAIESNGEIPEELNSEPSYHIDLTSLFEYLSFINVSGLARIIGINESLMRQYKRGDTYISDAQLSKIENALHKIGTTLTSIKLT